MEALPREFTFINHFKLNQSALAQRVLLKSWRSFSSLRFCTNVNYFRPARLSPTGVENPTAVPQQRQSAAEHYCAVSRVQLREHYCAVMPPQQSRKTHAGGLNVPTASSADGSSISLINFFLNPLREGFKKKTVKKRSG